MMEWATGGNPLASSAAAGQLEKNGDIAFSHGGWRSPHLKTRQPLSNVHGCCVMRSFVPILFRLFFFAALPALPVMGQQEPASSPAAEENFLDQMSGLEKAIAGEMSASAVKTFDAACARVREGYLKALATARAAAKEPDAVTILKAEEAAIAVGKLPPPADEPATPPALKKLRATFRQAWMSHEKERDRKAAPVYSKWAKQLLTLEQSAAKAGQTTPAAMIRARREEIAQEKPLTPASGFLPGSKPSPPPLILTGKSGRWSTGQDFIQWAKEHRVVNILMETAPNVPRMWFPGEELPEGELTMIRVEFPITDANITAADIADMRDFPRLEVVNLQGPGKLTSSMVDALSSLPALTELTLTNVDLPPQGPGIFGKLRLKKMWLSSVTGLNGELLAQLPPSLTSLRLGAREWSGGLKGLSALKALETLELIFLAGLRAADLGPVAATSVKELRLYNVQSLSNSLGTMPALPKVTSLYASGGVSATDVAALTRALPSLKSVSYIGEDGAVAAAFSACGNLEEAVLTSMTKNCDKLSALAACSRLKILRIGSTTGGNALASVGAIKSLERLEFTSCSDLGDEVAAAISSLESLNKLMVQICGISDGFLEPLKKIKTLRTLGITSCPKVSKEALKALRKELKGCQFID
jgi:hypothetical protein